MISTKEKYGVTRRAALQLLRKFGIFQNSTYAMRTKFGYKDQQNQQPQNPQKSSPHPDPRR